MKRRQAQTPIIFLCVLLFLDGFSFLGVLPSKAVIFDSVSDWLAGAGLPVVLLVSFLENVPLVNVYFPGSIAILTAMAGAAGSVIKIVTVWAVVSLGALCAQWLIFFLGKKILTQYRGKELVETALQPGASRDLFFLGLTSFWHPHLASMACLAMVDSGVEFKSFVKVSAFWTCAWNVFWTIFVVSFGNIFSEGGIGFVLVYLFLLVWIAFVFLSSKPGA